MTFLGGCRTSGPPLVLHLWVGDYEEVAIRNENGLLIPANMPAFNDYACLHKEEIKAVLKELKGRRRTVRPVDMTIVNELMSEVDADEE